MSRIDKLYLAAKQLFPKRIRLTVRIGEKDIKMPVAEAHRLIHAGKIKYDDIVDDRLNGGNYGKDLDIFLHLIACHGANSSHDLPEGKRNGMIVSKEEHDYFLSKKGEFDD